MIERQQIEKVLNASASGGVRPDRPVRAFQSQAASREKVREHAALKRLETVALDYFRILDELPASRQLAADDTADADMRALARDEIATLEARLPAAERATLAPRCFARPTDAPQRPSWKSVLAHPWRGGRAFCRRAFPHVQPLLRHPWLENQHD